MHTIEILGPGCQKCQYVERVVREVVAEHGIDADVRHVTDVREIVARGVLATPGLVIDGVLVLAGRVPTREAVAAWLLAPAAPRGGRSPTGRRSMAGFRQPGAAEVGEPG